MLQCTNPGDTEMNTTNALNLIDRVTLGLFNVMVMVVMPLAAVGLFFNAR